MKKVFLIGGTNSPNQKIKVIGKDVFVIPNRGMIVLKFRTIIPRFGTMVPCFGMSNVSRNDDFFNLIKHTFLPDRWQKITSKIHLLSNEWD